MLKNTIPKEALNKIMEKESKRIRGVMISSVNADDVLMGIRNR